MTKTVKFKSDKPKRQFFNGSEVTKTQAEAIKAVGGKIVTERNDEWFWRNW